MLGAATAMPQDEILKAAADEALEARASAQTAVVDDVGGEVGTGSSMVQHVGVGAAAARLKHWAAAAMPQREALKAAMGEALAKQATA